MPELRWILAAVGLVVVFMIYLWGRRGEKDDVAASTNRVAPSLDGSVSDAAPQMVESATAEAPEPVVVSTDLTESVAPNDLPEPEAPNAELPVPDRVIRMHIVARDGTELAAVDVVSALRAEGLRFAHHDLFHRFRTDSNPGPAEPPLFSVSDMLKPGTFDLSTLGETNLKGVTMLMGLPNAGDAVTVFADMLATGRRLAATFGGLLVDEKGCAVTRQSASHMREDIINFELNARRVDESVT
ncbi:MAG: cell division protein ZipA C-terminal FtsZ-binding domain-containing protein [Pseudomonadota bacterium]